MARDPELWLEELDTRLVEGVNRGIQIRRSVNIYWPNPPFHFRPESEIRPQIYQLHIKYKIRAQKIDESAIRCNCRIRKSLKSRFESEIRAKIFSKSAYSFAYSPPSLWNARYRFNLRYPQGFCNFLRCFLGPLSADCTKEKGHTFHSCKNDIEIRFPYSTDRLLTFQFIWNTDLTTPCRSRLSFYTTRSIHPFCKPSFTTFVHNYRA